MKYLIIVKQYPKTNFEFDFVQRKEDYKTNFI